MAQEPTQPPAHQHLPPAVINGDEHPEQVTDGRAWLMQLIASTSTDTDSDVIKKHAAVHQTTLGIAGFDAKLKDWRTHYSQLISDYNRDVKANASKQGTTNYQVARQAQLNQDIMRGVSDVVGHIQANTPQPVWEGLVKKVQYAKQKMGYTEDGPQPVAAPAVFHPGLSPKLLRTNSSIPVINFDAGSASGYTYYAALDTDASNIYVSVYAYGTSNAQWTCEWNQYSGMYEPPGCPAQHQFYFTNQINDSGPVNYYAGAEYDPTQYVSFSYGNSAVAIPDIYIKIAAGVAIICTVAGPLLKNLWKSNVMVGTSYFKLNGVGHYVFPLGIYCGLTPTCKNPRPWAIDGNFYWDLSGTSCNPASSCRGICVRDPIANVWSCPSDLTGAFCFNIWTPNYADCTPHP